MSSHSVDVNAATESSQAAAVRARLAVQTVLCRADWCMYPGAHRIPHTPDHIPPAKASPRTPSPPHPQARRAVGRPYVSDFWRGQCAVGDVLHMCGVVLVCHQPHRLISCLPWLIRVALSNSQSPVLLALAVRRRWTGGASPTGIHPLRILP